MSLARLARACAASTLFGLGASSCVDTTPVLWAPAVRLDASVASDAAEDAGDAEVPRSRCEECVRRERDEVDCRVVLESCDATAKCSGLARCSFDSGCFELNSEEKIRNCLIPCVIEVGIVSLDDPAVARYVDVSSCALNLCPDVCFTRAAP